MAKMDTKLDLDCKNLGKSCASDFSWFSKICQEYSGFFGIHWKRRFCRSTSRTLRIRTFRMQKLIPNYPSCFESSRQIRYKMMFSSRRTPLFESKVVVIFPKMASLLPWNSIFFDFLFNEFFYIRPCLSLRWSVKWLPKIFGFRTIGIRTLRRDLERKN